ncbi:MAG: ABC transporter ATP-binding protein [Candidatus Ornithospirochaeta sp.]
MILDLKNISKEYRVKGRKEVFSALSGVSLSLREGEVLGIVGESGSGKTTLSEIAGGLRTPTRGTVLFQGKDIYRMDRREWKEFRSSVQFIFQSPKESMNPYFTIRWILSEPLKINFPELTREEREEKMKDMLIRVGMDPETTLSFRPGHFSGGQLQRIAIARALLLSPKVIISDECTSALDVSLEAQIVNLLSSLKKETGVSMIFISHDISLVRYISDRIMVMKDGKVVEEGDSDSVMENPKSTYTKTLIETSFI